VIVVPLTEIDRSNRASSDPWKTLGVRLKQCELDMFHLELKKLGFSSLTELVRAVKEGTFTAGTPLVHAISNEIVNKIRRELLTSVAPLGYVGSNPTSGA
jgi:hypothetical protein